MDQGDEFLAGHFQQILQVDASVGELAEGALLSQLVDVNLSLGTGKSGDGWMEAQKRWWRTPVPFDRMTPAFFAPMDFSRANSPTCAFS